MSRCMTIAKNSGQKGFPVTAVHSVLTGNSHDYSRYGVCMTAA